MNALTTLACLKDPACAPGLAELAAAKGITCSGHVLEPGCVAHELYPVIHHSTYIYQDALGILAAAQPDGTDTSWTGIVYKVIATQ